MATHKTTPAHSVDVASTGKCPSTLTISCWIHKVRVILSGRVPCLSRFVVSFANTVSHIYSDVGQGCVPCLYNEVSNGNGCVFCAPGYQPDSSWCGCVKSPPTSIAVAGRFQESIGKIWVMSVYVLVLEPLCLSHCIIAQCNVVIRRLYA